MIESAFMSTGETLKHAPEKVSATLNDPELLTKASHQAEVVGKTISTKATEFWRTLQEGVAQVGVQLPGWVLFSCILRRSARLTRRFTATELNNNNTISAAEAAEAASQAKTSKRRTTLWGSQWETDANDKRKASRPRRWVLAFRRRLESISKRGPTR